MRTMPRAQAVKLADSARQFAAHATIGASIPWPDAALFAAPVCQVSARQRPAR